MKKECSLATSVVLRTLAEAFRFAEFFAGDANATWCLKEMGFPGLNFDCSYGGRFQNIFEPAGFASPGCQGQNFKLLFII